jgi:hypothetical protein
VKNFSTGLTRTLLGGCLAVLMSLVSLGCGGSDADSSSATGPTTNDALVDFQGMMKEISTSNQQPPKNPQELGRWDPLFPVASAALQNGSIVYFWGTPVNSSAPNAATTIVAYEPAAETQGGWVLYQDGNVKQVTADEFKSAQKPATKK